MIEKFFAQVIKFLQGPSSRRITGFSRTFCIASCVFFSAFYVYLAGPSFLGSPGVGMRRGLFMLLVAVIVFLKFPFNSKSPRDRASVMDWILITLSIVTFGYWIYFFEDYLYRVGTYHLLDVIFGTLAIILSLEITRRAMGYALPIIAGMFLVYGFFGNKMPGMLQHPGFPYYMIVRQIFSQDGIYGIVLYTTAAYVVLFVVFGALLHRFGAGEFFVEFPYALTCGMKAGPAKAAVVASAFFGMISGSATANTVATGAFTIPIMKRAGYKPHVAGAIEPAASTGGMFMPPVMGAAVFIMAELIQVPYVKIIKMAFVPALLYFFSVAVMVHLQADLDNIKIVPKAERPDPLPILKRGWYYLVPIFVLVYLILQDYSPARAVYVALILILVLNVFVRFLGAKEESPYQIIRKTIYDLYEGLIEGAESILPVASVVGTVGIVLAVIFQSGLGYIFTSNIVNLTGGILPLGILFAFLAAYILGMGMTVTSSYILLAVLVAPALIRMGVNPFAAHFMIFWYSQTSNISPPVCMAAFAGASIAKSDPYLTGFTALKYACMLIVIPVLFVYSSILMPEGLNLNVFLVWVTAFISMVPFGAAFIGYLVTKTSLIERMFLLVTGVFLISPNLIFSILGLVILVIIYFKQFKRKKYMVTYDSVG